MKFVNLVREGISYLRRFQFDPLLRFAIRSLDRFTERTVMREMSVEDEVPPIDGDVSYVVEQTNGYNQYFRVAESDALRYNSRREFTSLSFHVVDIRSVESCRVVVRFETATGETFERRVSLKNDKFNELGSVPFRLSVDEPAVSAGLKLVHADLSGQKRRPSEKGDVWQSRPVGRRCPQLSVPHSSASDNADYPIFLITVDTFRHDYLDAFSTLIEELGENCTVPTEPRTQGVCTWPSHASMFTGVHPGTHGSHAAIPNPPISQDLTTLPEFLERRGYTCSGCVGTISLRPQLGFARGFHRYCLKQMSWKDREFDARSNVEQIREWMRTDFSGDGRSNFYFLHLFDAHYPYFPLLPVANLETLDYELINRVPHPKEYREYLELIRNDPIEIDDADLSLIKTYYRHSLSHVESQLLELVRVLKQAGIFAESMVIITGDHGEDFYENKFLYHHSLYDENLRPGMMVKPPTGSSLHIPDNPDLIDIFPTVASLIDDDAPDQCVGESWMSERGPKPRITERLLDTYNISVEIGGQKGIFTYEENNPNRPSRDVVSAKPMHEEYYERADDATGRRFESADFNPEVEERLRREAEEFIRTQRVTTADGAVTPSGEVKARLEELGYK